MEICFLPIDNCLVERTIKPFVTGRKSCLFGDTPKSASASAQIYSRAETVKVNVQEPYTLLLQYLDSYLDPTIKITTSLSPLKDEIHGSYTTNTPDLPSHNIDVV